MQILEEKNAIFFSELIGRSVDTFTIVVIFGERKSIVVNYVCGLCIDVRHK